jgi:hypothetical protein
MRIYFFFNLQRQSLLIHEVALHLQNTRDWRDFAGIVVVKGGQHYEFLQQQTDVTYQYLDTTEQVDRAALDYRVTPSQLEKWEKRLDCPLWHLVVADRNIGRVFIKGGRILHTDFGKIATHENIARMVCYYLNFYQERLEAFRPDAVFLPASASMPTLALARVCQWMQIPFFILRHTRVLDRHIIAYNDPTERFLSVEKRFQDLVTQPNTPIFSEEARRYFDSFQEAQPIRPGYTVTLATAHQRLRHKNPLRFWGGIGYRLAKAACRWIYYQDRSKRDVRFSSPFEEWWLETQRIIGVRYSRMHQAEPSRVGEESYVYYPLHLNPEASTMILAPNFVNQLTIIEALAKNIPLTHKLYVKEHPSMIGRRPRSFYKEVTQYPNVRLISYAENSMRLSRHADLITVITGTAGWEAILMGQPVMTFGRSFYTALGASEQCSDFNQLGDQIRRLIFEDTEQVDQERIMLFLTALFESSFSLSTHIMWKKNLRPGKLDDEALTTAHKLADHLAATIECFYAAQPGVADSHTDG